MKHKEIIEQRNRAKQEQINASYKSQFSDYTLVRETDKINNTNSIVQFNNELEYDKHPYHDVVEIDNTNNTKVHS